MKRFALLVGLVVLCLNASAIFAQDSLTLTPIGTYATGLIYEGAAEINAYDEMNKRLAVVNAQSNSLDLIDITDPTTPTLYKSVSLNDFGGTANSVTIHGELIAVAVAAEAVDAAGAIVFLDLEGELVNSVEAGVLPDMVTFTPDGSKVVSANEGEPSDDYTVDPVGSVTIVDVATFTATQVSFEGVDAEGIRVYGPNATFAQDVEPEYVAVSADSMTAYVTLQENNALAVVDLAQGVVVDVLDLGAKDYSLEANAIDASDKDGAINLQTWPVMSLYLPDAIAAYEVNGETYLITANEGDARDYDGYSEEARVADLVLDATVFPNAAELQAEDQLGRLKTTTTMGDTDVDGDHDVIYGFGARSFTIWNTAGEVVFDSANAFETITAELVPASFNSDGSNESFDARSDDKGAEPEGVVVGEINGKFYAFICLERTGGVMVYDVTDPTAPVFQSYANNITPEGSVEAGTAGDIGPEGLKFISAEKSPNGMPLLIVSNEVSGTTTIYEIK